MSAELRTAEKRPRKIFWGWYIALVAASASFVTGGIYGTGFGVFFKPMAQDLGLTRTMVAGGATLRVASWGGFWEEAERKYLLDQLEQDFNCTVQYDSAWPWFPKFVAGGVDSPPFDVTNWNLPELFKTAKAGAVDGGFFVPIEEVQANVPNSADLWPFAYEFGHGITYLFSRLGYGYRTDTGDAPTDSTPA